MDLLNIFKNISEGEEFYSPLYGNIIFQKVRPFNQMQTNTPHILEFKTMADSTVLFNNEGKPIIFHPSGEMIFETNLGECMICDSNHHEKIDGVIKNIYAKINLES